MRPQPDGREIDRFRRSEGARFIPLQCTKSRRAVDLYRPLNAAWKRREHRALSLNYAKLNKEGHFEVAPKFGEARDCRGAPAPGAAMWKRPGRWNFQIAFGRRRLLRPGRPHSGGSANTRPHGLDTGIFYLNFLRRHSMVARCLNLPPPKKSPWLPLPAGWGRVAAPRSS
jgi:hypothetical protein